MDIRRGRRRPRSGSSGPSSLPGGSYAIEDTQTSYLEEFGGGGPGTPGTSMEMVKRLGATHQTIRRTRWRRCTSTGGWCSSRSGPGRDPEPSCHRGSAAARSDQAATVGGSPERRLVRVGHVRLRPSWAFRLSSTKVSLRCPICSPRITPSRLPRPNRRESDVLRRRAAVLRPESEQTRCDIEMLRSTADFERRRARESLVAPVARAA